VEAEAVRRRRELAVDLTAPGEIKVSPRGSTRRGLVFSLPFFLHGNAPEDAAEAAWFGLLDASGGTIEGK